MATVFTTILNMSLTASIIILIVLLVRLCLKKAPKIYSYLLWSVVLFRLLCPVSFILPVSVLSPMAEASTASETGYTASMEYISLPELPPVDLTAAEQHTGENAEPADDNVITALPDESAVVVEQQTAKKSAGEIALTVLGWLWVVGMAAVLGLTAWQTISLRRRLATAFLIRGNIFESEQIDTAFVLGVFNPKIYLPLNMPFDIQKAVIAHEQTHQRRGDHIVKLISYAALAAHWFNPLVWLSFKLMCDDMEKSCDESVISTMSNRGYTMDSTKKAYGHMLLALSDGRQHIFTPVSFAETGTKARVLNVVAYKQTARIAAIALTAACALVISLCVFNPIASSAAGSTEPGPDPNAVMLTVGSKTFRSDVTELDLGSQPYDVLDISPLAQCTHLRELNLSYNTIEDLTPLSECSTLRSLNLESVTLYDPSGISLPTRLESLNLYGISLDDYSFLSSCKNLKELNIKSNLTCLDSTDLEILSSLTKLETLRFDDMHTECIPQLAQFKNLSFIGFENFFYADEGIIYPDSTLDGLETLLETLPDLEGLACGVWNDETVDLIAQFTNLRSLELYVSFDGTIRNFHELDALSSLTGLKHLKLITTSSFYYDFLSCMPELETVFISFDANEDSSVLMVPDIHGLAGCTGLKKLQLMTSGGALILTPIYSLPELEVLCIYSEGGALDLARLSCAEQLTSLDLSGLKLTNPNHLGDLRNVEHLSISYCNILSESVDLFAPIGKMTGLRTLHLLFEGDDDYKVDFSFARNMRELESVIVIADNVCGLSGLGNSSKVTNLDISNIASDEDFSSLACMTDMAYTHLHCPQGMSDISFLSGMDNLTEVTLHGTFENVESLRNKDKLGWLELTSDRLTDISALESCSALKSIYFTDCRSLSDASALAGCKSLDNLHFTQCDRLADCSFLPRIPNLSSLGLAYVPVSDLSFLSDIEHLDSFELCGITATDYSPLADAMPRIDWFSFLENDISRDMALELCKASPQQSFSYDEGLIYYLDACVIYNTVLKEYTFYEYENFDYEIPVGENEVIASYHGYVLQKNDGDFYYFDPISFE